MSRENEQIVIDGATGEGGGQVLRTSLALALVTRRPFRIEHIRAKRKKPGLLRQHLTAVNAAARIGCAEMSGAEIGSDHLEFRPQEIVAGDYTFSVGTAGSATLVLQTILPPLLTASQPSRLVLEGGTHNPMAPPWDFLERTFLPQIRRMGPTVETTLERYGFYPAGGGCFRVHIQPVARLAPLTLGERGPITGRRARALVASLPRRIGDTEIDCLREKIALEREHTAVEEISGSPGPGNLLMLEMISEQVTEIFTGFGERGVPAFRIAAQVGDAARHYLTSNAAVAEHLTDQLLLPMALAGKGSFLSTGVSQHAHTNIDVIQKFLDIAVRVERAGDRSWQVTIG
jgi:RNA 3'-terminal phosphate cyclase (ATP)